MKAAAVDYVRPRSLAEAVDLLAQHRDEARVTHADGYAGFNG